jgi:hypothetical protein
MQKRLEFIPGDEQTVRIVFFEWPAIAVAGAVVLLAGCGVWRLLHRANHSSEF